MKDATDRQGHKEGQGHSGWTRMVKDIAAGATLAANKMSGQGHNGWLRVKDAAAQTDG